MVSLRNRSNSIVTNSTDNLVPSSSSQQPYAGIDISSFSTTASASPVNSPNVAAQHLLRGNPELSQQVNVVGRHHSSLSIQSDSNDLSPTGSTTSNSDPSKRWSVVNPFRKNSAQESKTSPKRKEVIETERVIIDEREPKLNLFSYFTIIRIIGWDFIPIFIGLIGAMGRGAIPMMFQYVLGDMLNVFQPKNGVYPTTAEIKANVNSVAINFAIVAGSSGVASFITYYFLGWAAQRIGVKMRKVYFEHLTKQEIAFFDIKQTGQLTLPLSEDIYKIQDTLSNKLASFFQNVTQFVLGVTLAFITTWELTLVMISTSPFMIVGYAILAKFVEIFDRKASAANEKSSIVATEVISSIRTVRSMGCEEKEQERFSSYFKRTQIFGFIRSCFDGVAWGSFSLVMWGTNALAWWYGGHMVADGKLSVGELMKTFGMIIYSVYGMTDAGLVIPYFAAGFSCLKRLLKVIKRKPEIPFKGGKTLTNLKGSIRFEDISFEYPSRSDVKVLEKFSLDILPGTSIAMVGPSGSGKTTVVSLLERFYETKSGNIYLDGVNIKEIDPIWLHKNIGIVTQEPVLFSCSIRENIAYAVGMENVTQQQIEQAAKTANCHHFIMELPDGYNTKLGEKGISLSGGQKQRVAIARAVLQNPQILLLDEATSALDTESEGLVQSALDQLMKGRTTICVAHRLSTIRNCDKICVMVKGDVKEAGSHQELMQKEGGVYKKLVEKQLQLGISEIPKSEETAMDPASEVAISVISRKMTSSVIKI